MCRYLCIAIIDFMLKGKNLLDYTKLFYPNDYEKNNKIMLTFFLVTKKMKKLYCIICRKHKKLEKPKIPHLLEKKISFCDHLQYVEE